MGSTPEHALSVMETAACAMKRCPPQVVIHHTVMGFHHPTRNKGNG